MKSILLIISILLFALYLRLLVVGVSQVHLPLRSDAGQYFSYAYNLKYHNVYSIAESWRTGAVPIADDLRNPGYPVFLAFLLDSKANSENLKNIALVQAILSTVAVALVYATLRRFSSVWVSAGGALLTASSPHLINMNVYMMSESLAAFIMVFFLWFYAWSTTSARFFGDVGVQGPHVRFLQLLGVKTYWPWFILGAVHAAGTLVRPTMQWYLVPLLAIVYALPEQRWGLAWCRVSSLLLGFAVLMLPWWIRNLLQFGELSNSLLTINTLHHGMYPNFTYENVPESFGYPHRFDPRSSEIAASVSSVIAEIMNRFRDDPGKQLFWYLVGKPIMFWNWSNDAGGAGDIFIFPMLRTPFAANPMLKFIHDSMHLLHVPIVVVGMIGSFAVYVISLVRCQVSDIELLCFLRVVAGILIYFVVLHMIGAPFPRYNIPILPVLYIQIMLSYSLFRNIKVKPLLCSS